MRVQNWTVRGGRAFTRLGGLSVTALLVALAGIGPSRAQTLNEALASAYLSNPTLQAAQAELRRTDEEVPQALAGWRPQADLTGGGGGVASQGQNGQRANLSARNGTAFALDLRVRQPLYNFGTPASVKQAEDAVKAQRARATAVEQDVLAHAATAYADVLRAQNVLELNESHGQLMRRDLDSVRRRFSAGELRSSDVAEAEASVAQATAQRTQAEADLASAREVYRVWVGDPSGSLVEPELPKDLPATQEEVAQLSSANPNVLAADYAVKAASQGVDVSFGQKLPQFFLQGDVGASSQSILALVSVPLYNGTLDPQIRAAKQLVDQRRLEAEAERRTARQAALGAWQKFVAAQANIASYRAQVAAAQAAEEGVSREQALGLRTVENMLSAQDRLLNARMSLTGARRDTFQAAIQVLASVGRLTARDLGLDVPYYDPQQHYDEVRSKWWGTAADEK
jgi:TolC family type I secretion outer membrane protein